MDPWFPRPLVSSRYPVGEEGTFIAFCPHLMHAGCKEKYASQLKSRNEQILLRSIERSPAFEFRCPVCRSLSNFDLPLYGRLQDSLPCEWITQRLVKNNFDLATWLRRIQRWLDERPANHPIFNLNQPEVPDGLKLLLTLLQTTPETGAENQTALKTLLFDVYLRAETTFSPESVGLRPTSPSNSATAHRSFAIMRQARSLFRFCFRLTEAGQEAEDGTAVESGGSRMPSTTILNTLPTHPLRVSTNLRVLVQRISQLGQPRPVPRRPRTTVAAASIAIEGLPNDELMFHIMADTILQSDLEDTDDEEMPATLADGGGHLQFIGLTPAGVENSDYEDNDGDEGGYEVMPTPILAPRPPPRYQPTSSSKTAKRRPNASPPPPSLNEAAMELHTSLMSAYSRLFSFSQLLMDPVSSIDTQEKTIEERFDAAVSHLKAAFTCCRRRGLRAIQSAACEWRALRHSVAYTLVVWERYLRQLGPDTHFFNGELAERHKIGLGYLIRASLQAHAKLAPVSRGCGPDECLGQQGSAHPACWPQRRDDPQWWWWYTFFAPPPDGSTEDQSCCYSAQCLVQNLVEPVTRIAVSEDAARLWRLLLPDSNSLSPTASNENIEKPPLIINPSATMHEVSPESRNLPISLLWEADITFLFINLIFLRPGLESSVSGNYNTTCQRATSEFEKQLQVADEGKTALGDVLICSCDEGYPRLPVGDSHELFTLRLCYVGLLVQALLSWQPPPSNSSESSVGFQDAHTMLWMNEKLLTVRRRLQHLSGLPVGQETPSSQLLMHLYQHIRSHAIPFLRVAAFIVREITDIDVPAALLNRSNSSSITDLTPVNEFSLLLSYLGLPSDPTDLCVLLSSSDEQTQLQEKETDEKAFLTTMAEDQLSSSLWMARLITSWCLVGRKAASRSLFARLQALYAPLNDSISSSSVLLPEPSIRVPHLIRLPRQYVSLLTLATELKSVHSGSNIHSDPSLCLVCGAVACFTCYSCRTFEPVDDASSGSTRTATSAEDAHLHRVGHDCVVYDIQVHVRRYHAGYAPIMLLYSGRLLILSEQARRTTELTAPYRDEFGETDTGLRRGNPLFLDEVAYQNLNEMWVNHQIISSTTSNIFLA